MKLASHTERSRGITILPLFSRSLNRILVPLVVLDLMLPEMDGLDMAHAIRKEESHTNHHAHCLHRRDGQT